MNNTMIVKKFILCFFTLLLTSPLFSAPSKAARKKRGCKLTVAQRAAEIYALHEPHEAKPRKKRELTGFAGKRTAVSMASFTDSVKCPYCPNVFAEKGLKIHIGRKHREKLFR